MEFILAAGLLIAGFYLVIKGADFLVRGSSSLAKRLNVREIAIGLTLIAFGTSLPETFVNIISSISNQNDIVFGNIIGSNIFNILAILGIAGMLIPIAVNKNTLFKEIPFSLFAALLLFLAVNDSIIFDLGKNELSRFDGAVFMVFFIVFLLYVFRISKDKTKHVSHAKLLPVSTTAIYIIAGFFALFAGAKLVVDSSVAIAAFFGVSKKLIALTIVAAGTSLPELATSAVAAYKKKYELAMGNIVGSNIFNIFFILGISSFIRPAAYNQIMNIDILVLVFSSLFLFFAVYSQKDKKLHKLYSFLFLVLYISYVIYLFYRG